MTVVYIVSWFQGSDSSDPAVFISFRQFVSDLSFSTHVAAYLNSQIHHVLSSLANPLKFLVLLSVWFSTFNLLLIYYIRTSFTSSLYVFVSSSLISKPFSPAAFPVSSLSLSFFIFYLSGLLYLRICQILMFVKEKLHSTCVPVLECFLKLD